MINSANNFKDIPSELLEPMETISSFFDAGNPKEHRKDLKRWRYYVINSKQFKSRFGASHVVAVYEETIELINTAYVLSNNHKALSLYTSVTENDIRKERNDWDYYPANLKEKSLLNPANVIAKFFKEISLDKYIDVIHEWLHLALSDKAASETLTAKEIIDVYDNLKKLYSATWLIYKRQL